MRDATQHAIARQENDKAQKSLRKSGLMQMLG